MFLFSNYVLAKTNMLKRGLMGKEFSWCSSVPVDWSLVRFVFKTNALSELELLSIFQIVFQLPLFLLEEQFSPLFVWKIILALVKFLLLDIQGIYIHIFTITYLGLSPFCDHTIRPYLSHWTGHRALDNRERWHMSPRVNISAVLLSNSCLKFHI